MLTLATDILALERGELDKDQTIALFQKLIDTGTAWTLRGGAFRRVAFKMIAAGLCRWPTSTGRLTRVEEAICPTS